MNENARNKYGNIIDMPHHQSEKRPHMSMYDRAAQFSPFAALTGHSDAIKETARLTDVFCEPSEEIKSLLNEKLLFLKSELSNEPNVSITYFKPDEKKSGGAYITVEGIIKKIRKDERLIQMTTGDLIPIDMIFDIDGEIFGSIDY